MTQIDVKTPNNLDISMDLLIKLSNFFSEFSSNINILIKFNKADAKSILSLSALNLNSGDKFSLNLDGISEKKEAEKINDYLNSLGFNSSLQM